MTDSLSNGMSFKADAVANAFLSIEAAKNQVTPMKLQKLAYFAHGWYLALLDLPLVIEPVQAWKYGPVIQSIYREFREFGGDAITRLARDVTFTPERGVEECTPRIDDTAAEPDYVKKFIFRIWDLYGGYSGAQLSTMTHKEGTPWQQIVSAFGGRVPVGIDIPNDMIREYFKSELSKSN